MAKFYIGQMVKYVGREGFWSPPEGVVGIVLKINHWGTNFLVEFPEGSIVSLDRFPNGSHFWYSEDELEPANDPDIIKKVKVRYAKHGWERAKA